MAATLKVHKWHTWNVCVRLFNGLHSHIRHYRVLPWTMGPLTSLESITEVSDKLLQWFKCEKRLGTTYRDLSTRTILQWFSSTPCQYLVLYAILLPRPEAQLSTCLVTTKDEDGNSQGRVVGHRSEICMLPGKYYLGYVLLEQLCMWEFSNWPHV